MPPATGAVNVAVHVTDAVADPTGPNNGTTFGDPASAPGHEIAEPATTESVTATSAKNDVPVFDTTNDTTIDEPATTDTPGAVFASSPLIDFTTDTPAVAGANA